MYPRLTKIACAAAALALCASPTMAAAAPMSAIQPINPLVAVSVFGTQASAQAACAQGASAAAAAGAAVAAQGQPGCVLPAADAPPPVGEVPGPAALPPTGNYGINWLLAGLGALALIAGLSTLFDDDDGLDSISP